MEKSIHGNDFDSFVIGSEFCDAESLPKDFVSLDIGSESCEMDSLPKLIFALFSANFGIIPLEFDFSSGLLFNRVLLPTVYGSMRCQGKRHKNIYQLNLRK